MVLGAQKKYPEAEDPVLQFVELALVAKITVAHHVIIVRALLARDASIGKKPTGVNVRAFYEVYRFSGMGMKFCEVAQNGLD